MVSKIVKYFHCLICGKEVADGDGGMLELGLCFNCIYDEQFKAEEEIDG